VGEIPPEKAVKMIMSNIVFPTTIKIGDALKDRDEKKTAEERLSKFLELTPNGPTICEVVLKSPSEGMTYEEWNRHLTKAGIAHPLVSGLIRGPYGLLKLSVLTYNGDLIRFDPDFSKRTKAISVSDTGKKIYFPMSTVQVPKKPKDMAKLLFGTDGKFAKKAKSPTAIAPYAPSKLVEGRLVPSKAYSNPMIALTLDQHRGLAVELFQVNDELAELAREAVYHTATSATYVANPLGQVGGVLDRLSKAFDKPKMAPFGAKTVGALVNGALGVLPAKKTPNPDLRDHHVVLNADAGIGYLNGNGKMQKKGDVLEQIVEDCDRILEILRQDGSVSSIIKEYPGFNWFVLKSKLEASDIRKLKNRPYGVGHAAAALLGGVVMKAVKDNWGLFYENPNYFNAVGFAWAHGGAAKAAKWYFDTPKGNARAKGYGDDLAIAVRLTNGDLFTIKPDGDQFDVSLAALERAIMAYIDVVGTKTYGEESVYARVLEVCAALAFNCNLSVVDTVCLKWVKFGIISGVPGTTVIDMIANAMVWTSVKKVFIGLDTEEELKSAVMNATAIAAQLGVRWKPDTLKIAKIAEDYVPLPFLGMELRFIVMVVKGEEMFGWVPIPDKQKVVISLVATKQQERTDVGKKSYWLANMLGVILSGGWYYQDIYNAVLKVAEKYLEDPHVSIANLTEEDFSGMDLDTISAFAAGRRFPTREECFLLYATETEIKVEPYESGQTSWNDIMDDEEQVAKDYEAVAEVELDFLLDIDPQMSKRATGAPPGIPTARPSEAGVVVESTAGKERREFLNEEQRKHASNRASTSRADSGAVVEKDDRRTQRDRRRRKGRK
jgi:hypothetical protein